MSWLAPLCSEASGRSYSCVAHQPIIIAINSYPIIVVTIAQGPQLHYQNNVLQSIEGRMIVIGYAAWRMMAQSILEIQKK